MAVGAVGGHQGPISDQERDQILAALREGQRVVDVMVVFGRSEHMIRKISRTAGVFAARPPAAKQYRDLKLTLVEPVARLLAAAAARRTVSAEDLAGAILTGVLTRGSVDRPPSVDRALEMAKDYELQSGGRRD
jgi:hypothetical protein